MNELDVQSQQLDAGCIRMTRTDVIISQGQTEEPVLTTLPEYEATCNLCPGNERSNGNRNPMYMDTFVSAHSSQ